VAEGAAEGGCDTRSSNGRSRTGGRSWTGNAWRRVEPCIGHDIPRCVDAGGGGPAAGEEGTSRGE
jgi:hypothetical protein